MALKKDLGIILGLFALVVILMFVGSSFTVMSFLTGENGSANGLQKNRTIVTSGSLMVDAEVAASPDSRKKGLSGRDSLDLNKGMLFVFDSSGDYGFWMKDVNFAIDIIWIDENKKITAIAHSVPPEKGKKNSELTVYKPGREARYALEVNAGLAKLNNLQIGDTVSFEL